jgi:hypothetical protein
MSGKGKGLATYNFSPIPPPEGVADPFIKITPAQQAALSRNVLASSNSSSSVVPNRKSNRIPKPSAKALASKSRKNRRANRKTRRH